MADDKLTLNIGKTKIISDRNNTYFTDNRIITGTGIPTEGVFRTGDIVVNIGPTSATEPMWICNEGGEPGIWGPVSTGGGNNNSSGSLVTLNEVVIVNDPVNEVSFTLPISSDDTVFVHHNSIHLVEGLDYEINYNDKKIVKLTEGNWNASDIEECVFSFDVLKYVTKLDGNTIEVKTQTVFLQNVVELGANAVDSINIGINEFNNESDALIVFENARFLTNGIDYEINGRSIVPVDGKFNEIMADDCSYTFIVLKNMPVVDGDVNTTLDGSVIADNSISIDKLDASVQEAIENAANAAGGGKFVSVQNTRILEVDTNEVEIGITGFNKDMGMLLVFKNSVHMVEGIEYNINADSTKIVKIEGNWRSDDAFVFIALSNVMSDEEINNIDLSNYVTKEDLESKQDKTDNNLATNAKDLVGAINELFQNANNGKEIIADAIGEPLNPENTFAAMGNDINGLLSTFKTNMMNNGITVNSGDKFKSLIDKIATMVEEGGNKGIQYAEGTIGDITFTQSEVSKYTVYNIPINIGFTPTVFFFEYRYSQNPDDTIISINNITNNSDNPVFYGSVTSQAQNWFGLYIGNVSSTNCELYYRKGLYASSEFENVKYYAIGVGEEDTTLRDSLASILGEEGVEVTEDDDMADLIVKVDEEFEKDNIIIDGININKQLLVDVLVEKGSKTSSMDNTWEELIEKIRKYLTKSSSSTSTNGTYTSVNASYLGLPTGNYDIVVNTVLDGNTHYVAYYQDRSSSGYYVKLQSCDINTGTVNTLAGLNQAIAEFDMVLLNGNIYTIGGYSQSSTHNGIKSINQYNISTNTWTAKGDLLIEGVTSTSAVGYNNKIHIFGGAISSSSATNKHQIYDPILNTVTEGNALANSVESMGRAISDNGIAYLIAGKGGGYYTGYNACYAYDCNSNTMTSIAKLPNQRYTTPWLCCCVGKVVFYNSQWYITTSSGTASADEVYKYNITTNKWTTVSNEDIEGGMTIVAGDNFALYVNRFTPHKYMLTEYEMGIEF